MIDLSAETDRLLDFAERSRHPEGGFAWLRADGTPYFERPRELWITTRMTHLLRRSGALLGHPGSSSDLVAHGLVLAARRLPRRRARRLVRAGRRAPTDKRAYEHVFVVLAAARGGRRGAAGRGAPGARRGASGTRTRARSSMSGTAAGPTLERYRGANANMHGVEAMLATEASAVARAGGSRHAAARRRQPPAAQRALRRRLVPAAGLQHRSTPRIPSGPTGRRSATPSSSRHGRRYTLDAGAFEADARRLFAAGVRDGWDGFGLRLHRRLGRPAGRRRSPALGAVRGDRSPPPYLGRTSCRPSGGRSPSCAFIDRELGSWRHELDPSNRPACPGLARQARRLSRTAGDAHPAAFRLLGSLAASLICRSAEAS